MTDDEILAIAMEHYHGVHPDDPEWQKPDMISFARAIAAGEREACAEVCVDMSRGKSVDYDFACGDCAAAIHARSET